VKTHIDPKNLKVHDDVGDNQENVGDFSLKDQVFLFTICGIAGTMVLQICNLVLKNSMPKMEHVSLGLIAALFLLFSRWAFVWLSRPLMHKFAAGFDNTRVVQEMADSLFQAIYVTVMVIVGYIYIKDQSYFPSCMGGSGGLVQIAKGGISKELISYYSVQIGYYVHCLSFLYFNKRKSDTLEKVLCTQISLFVAFSAYAQGYERFGVVMLLLHDFGNALAFLLKVLKEGEIFLPTMFVFATLLPIWMYTRIYLMITVFVPWIMETITARGQGQKFNSLLLPIGMLMVNNVYRFFTLAYQGIDALMNENTKFSS